MGKGTISGLPEEWLEPPWWLGVVLAVVAYVLLKWVIPAVAVTTGLLRPVASTSQASAAYVGALFLALTGLSLILAYRRRRALELETSLDRRVTLGSPRPAQVRALIEKEIAELS